MSARVFASSEAYGGAVRTLGKTDFRTMFERVPTLVRIGKSATCCEKEKVRWAVRLVRLADSFGNGAQAGKWPHRALLLPWVFTMLNVGTVHDNPIWTGGGV